MAVTLSLSLVSCSYQIEHVALPADATQKWEAHLATMRASDLFRITPSRYSTFTSKTIATSKLLPYLTADNFILEPNDKKREVIADITVEQKNETALNVTYFNGGVLQIADYLYRLKVDPFVDVVLKVREENGLETILN